MKNHDDKVSSTHLGKTYDATAAAWLARYKVPFSQCGCQQGDISALESAGTTMTTGKAIPEKFKFWTKKVNVGGGGKKEERRSGAGRFIAGMQKEEKDASHPSVHNLVHVRTLLPLSAARSRSRRPLTMYAVSSQMDLPSTVVENTARLNKIKQLDVKSQALANASAASEKHLVLKRALMKDPTHPDPFVQDTPLALRTADGKRAVGGSLSSSLPYWGVAVGAGLVSGGPQAWGLAITDPHAMMEEDCTRGGCAVGAGAGGGGYCSSSGGGGRGACTSVSEDRESVRQC
ncbi:hypothetical protein QFC22_005124 [Naganishia vaughanmartiniae]|uniref:Uncharacterized protein n=1 Tax=Naganishia vaughanmartiniae TaxID=1424756 RepID=A0ACC2WXW0_9TREE|nr:hypothetical protein QFC22_005124 [Naganishia vaughanmartiniae]